MIEQFVKDLLKEKGLPNNLEPAVYDELVKGLTDRAERMVNQRLLDKLSDEQFSEFEKLMTDKPDESAIQSFIESHVPDKEKVAAAALADFRALYLGAK